MRAETPAKQIVRWIGIAPSKFFDWKKRYGKVNEHGRQSASRFLVGGLGNGSQFISRDFKEFIRIAGMTHMKTSPY